MDTVDFQVMGGVVSRYSEGQAGKLIRPWRKTPWHYLNIPQRERDKIASLRDKMLHVDTGDPALDREFPSFLRVTTAPGQQAMARVGKAQG